MPTDELPRGTDNFSANRLLYHFLGSLPREGIAITFPEPLSGRAVVQLSNGQRFNVEVIEICNSEESKR